MPKDPLKIDQLRELIHKGEAKDPLIFLEAVMNGQDPRQLSGIYDLIMEIDSFTNGELSKADWNELVDYCLNHAKYKNVSLSESHSAAKTLAEYLHPKRKHVEMGGGLTSGTAEDSPLTEDEILIFKEKFNDDF